MLKNIDPLLGPDLLRHLAAMGHGDVLCVVDRNFPADANAQRLVSLRGVGAIEAIEAILSVFPIDTFVEPAAHWMQPVGDTGAALPIHGEFEQALESAEGRRVVATPIERFEFYRQAASSYLIVATTEDRPYGCFLLTKGVV